MRPVIPASPEEVERASVSQPTASRNHCGRSVVPKTAESIKMSSSIPCAVMRKWK
ncbi:MAG: hypothetical protein ACE5QW_04690 [Thermoplasmata archaeon]